MEKHVRWFCLLCRCIMNSTMLCLQLININEQFLLSSSTFSFRVFFSELSFLVYIVFYYITCYQIQFSMCVLSSMHFQLYFCLLTFCYFWVSFNVSFALTCAPLFHRFAYLWHVWSVWISRVELYFFSAVTSSEWHLLSKCFILALKWSFWDLDFWLHITFWRFKCSHLVDELYDKTDQKNTYHILFTFQSQIYIHQIVCYLDKNVFF